MALIGAISHSVSGYVVTERLYADYNSSTNTVTLTHTIQTSVNVSGMVWGNYGGIYLNGNNMGTYSVQYNTNEQTTKTLTISASSSGITSVSSYTIYPWAGVNQSNSTISGSITTAIAPSNPTISGVLTGEDSLTGTLNISSWGTPNSGRFEYYFGTTNSTTDDYVLVPANGYSTAKTASINKTNLDSNQVYYIRARVWNQQLNNPSGLVLFGPYYTKCPAPVFSVNSQIRTSYNKTIVTFNYETPNDNGSLSKELEYSLDGLTWASTGEVVSSGSQTTGTFSLTLDAETDYTIYLKSTTSAGSSSSTNIQLETLPKSEISYTVDYKDSNPISVAITGNDKLFIYNQSVLQFTIDNIRSEYNTPIGTTSLSINGRNFIGTTTFTTSNGITTNDSPIVINYGTVDFEGTKTATISISDSEGHDIYTKTVNISVLQRAKIGTVTYSFNDKPFYLTSTMTVDSWFGASSKALVKCKLYWTGDGGQTYDYTISDILNIQPWITISPNKWTATTSAEVPQVTQYTQFTVTLDLTEATGDYSGNTPWHWIIDKAKAGEFDNFSFEWSIETENGVDTKSITNLTTPQNYEFKLIEGVVVNDVLTQVVRDIDFDFIRFLNNSQLQRNRDIRRLILIKNS